MGNPGGNETKTDGIYSGNALLWTSFTLSAAMEAVELELAESWLAADFSLSWKLRMRPTPLSPHMLSQYKESTILTIDPHANYLFSFYWLYCLSINNFLDLFF